MVLVRVVVLRLVVLRVVVLRVVVLLGSVLLGSVLLGLVPGGGARADGPWDWPLPERPEVLRPFAPGPTPYSPGHYGADLAAAAGTPVLAAGAGRVAFAGRVAGRGVVVLEHAGTGLRTSYEPVDALVALGDEVATGEVVGLVEPFGHACAGGGSCLHWGLRRGEAYLDPLRLVRRPVRLLPSDGGGPLSAVPPGPGSGGSRAMALRPVVPRVVPRVVVASLRVLLPVAAAGLVAAAPG